MKSETRKENPHLGCQKRVYYIFRVSFKLSVKPVFRVLFKSLQSCMVYMSKMGGNPPGMHGFHLFIV